MEAVTAVKIHNVYENPFNFLKPLTANARKIKPEISMSPVTFVNFNTPDKPALKINTADIIKRELRNLLFIE